MRRIGFAFDCGRPGLGAAGGDVAARPHAGGPQFAIPSTHYQALTDLVAADPDATLAHLCDAWFQQTGVRVSQATMCRTLATIGLPRKKRV